MKQNFIYVICVFFAGCGVADRDIDAIKTENTALKSEIQSLKAQINDLEAKQESSPVTLANTETRKLKSAFNGQTYLIKIKLPGGYDSGEQSYPVLYVTDAETNFGGISYIIQRLIKDELIPEMLVVGIAYDTDYESFYKLRSRDLTPTEVKNVRVGGKIISNPTGGADRFCDFIAKELFPFIEQNYRIQKNDRALYGHSYGGLFGCYVLMKRPQLFNRYLLLSPSLWYDNDLIIKDIKTVGFHLNPTILFMASGELEGRIDDLQIEFVDSLKQINPSNLRIKSEVLPNETHRTVFGAGFTDGLRFIYASRH